MGRKLYSKGISPACAYCMHGDRSEDGSLVFCVRKGILSPDYHCRKFKYDPLLRVPRISPDIEEYSKEDFEL